MSKESDSPDPVDPVALAKAQAEANRISQYTPTGNILFGTVNPDGSFKQGTGGAASYIEQTPFQEQSQKIGEGTALQLANALAPQAGNLQQVSLEGLPERLTGIDFSGISAIPDASSFSEDAERVEQATYDRAMGLLQPQLEQQEGRLTQALADQGLPIGSEAYIDERNRFDQSRQRALTDTALAAVDAGRQEQQRLFGNALTTRGTQISDQLTNAQLAEAARTGGFGEQQAVRTQQLQELAALLGQQYNPTPGSAFIPPGQVDVLGANQMAQNAQLAQYNAQQATNQANLGGLYGLGAAGIMAFA